MSADHRVYESESRAELARVFLAFSRKAVLEEPRLDRRAVDVSEVDHSQVQMRDDQALDAREVHVRVLEGCLQILFEQLVHHGDRKLDPGRPSLHNAVQQEVPRAPQGFLAVQPDLQFPRGVGLLLRELSGLVQTLRGCHDLLQVGSPRPLRRVACHRDRARTLGPVLAFPVRLVEALELPVFELLEVRVGLVRTAGVYVVLLVTEQAFRAAKSRVGRQPRRHPGFLRDQEDRLLLLVGGSGVRVEGDVPVRVGKVDFPGLAAPGGAGWRRYFFVQRRGLRVRLGSFEQSVRPFHVCLFLAQAFHLLMQRESCVEVRALLEEVFGSLRHWFRYRVEQLSLLLVQLTHLFRPLLSFVFRPLSLHRQEVEQGPRELGRLQLLFTTRQCCVHELQTPVYFLQQQARCVASGHLKRYHFEETAQIHQTPLKNDDAQSEHQEEGVLFEQQLRIISRGNAQRNIQQTDKHEVEDALEHPQHIRDVREVGLDDRMEEQVCAADDDRGFGELREVRDDLLRVQASEDCFGHEKTHHGQAVEEVAEAELRQREVGVRDRLEQLVADQLEEDGKQTEHSDEPGDDDVLDRGTADVLVEHGGSDN